MNRKIYALLTAIGILTLTFEPVSSQINMLGYRRLENLSLLSGGLGYTAIDGESYANIFLAPEISLGKVGVGLSINLLYNTRNGQIRDQDWDEGYDYLRLVRYVRYGWKGDPFYTRIGVLDAHRIGHGFIINYYSNAASWDGRKIGLALDLDLGRWGVESMTSNLGRGEIFGGRLFFRPIKGLTSIPVIGNFSIAMSYVTDLDPDENRETSGDKVSIYGFDVELPFVDYPIFWTAVYADYARISDFGSGSAVGITARLKNLGGLASIEARLERRWLGSEFIPGYFDGFYEIDKFSPQGGAGIYKTDLLLSQQGKSKGIFGELYASFIGLLDVFGNFQKLDAKPGSGSLHFGAFSQPKLPVIALEASYDKRGVGSFSDAFTFDDRSIARIGMGYKIKPYLFLFMDYIWTFRFDEESERYVPQERYAPRLVFSYEFPI